MTDDADGAEVEVEDPEADAEAAEANADATGEADATDEENETPSLADRVAEHDEELAEEVAALEAERDELDAEAADLRERLQRTQADFQNYKKRAKRRQDEVEERATEDLVTRLLDVRDDLTRALGEESGNADSLREGVEMTKRELDRVFEDEGVEEISPEPGTETDPHRHETMLEVSSDEPAGTVAEVYRPGYEMGEKVLRAAQVTVSDGSGDDGADADGDA